jgi:hypothetical protein
MKRWYHIKARCMNIFKPDGSVIKFWLKGNDETEIAKLVIKKGYRDIEWIAEETPPFV